jgi:hypothetical protein
MSHYSKDTEKIYKYLIQRGDSLAKADNFWTYFILIIIEFSIAIFCLPGKTGINMIEAFFMEDWLKMIIISVVIPWVFGFLAYFVAYKYLKDWLQAKISSSPYYIIICKEVKKSPYQIIVV